jgi:hypothetical protein
VLRALALLSLLAAPGCYASHGAFDDAGGISSAVTMPCPGGAGAGSRRDCGFRVERVETCTPGRTMTVGCGCEGLGSCTGDPVLRLCAGADACRVAAALANVDDDCGLCPSAVIRCPEEGRFTILTAPFGSGAYTCSVAVR